MNLSFTGVAVVRANLLASILLLIVGCASPPTHDQRVESKVQDLQQSIAKEVADAERRTLLLDLANQLNDISQAFQQQHESYYTEFQSLNSEYSSSRAELEKLVSDFLAIRHSALRQAIAVHLQMTESTTPDEWKKIGKKSAKLFTASIDFVPQFDAAATQPQQLVALH